MQEAIKAGKKVLSRPNENVNPGGGAGRKKCWGKGDNCLELALIKINDEQNRKNLFSIFLNHIIYESRIRTK